LADSRQIGFNVEGHDPNERVWSWNTLVSSNYFAAMGIPLRRGRSFDSRSIPGRPLEIVVNESMAREYWPNQDAIGKRIHWGDRLLTIVGIAGDVRLSALDAAPPPTVYGDVFETVSGATTNAVFVIRQQTSDPERIKTGVEKIIWSVDPGLPVFGTRTLETVVSRSLATREFTMTVLTGFGAVSLLLATIGVYGLLSYTVSQRTREFGVRLALGSPASDLRWLVLWNGLGVLTVGVVGGLLLSVLSVRGLSTLLFGLDPLDPLTFGGAGALLFAVGLLASYVPARRATRVDPIVALRHE
jgi:predicted permease